MRISVFSFLFLLFVSIGTAISDEEERIEIEGIIEPSIVLELSSGVEGLLDAVHVDRSHYLEKGQVVARLESSVEQANVEVAAANAENTASIEVFKERLKFLELEAKRYSQLFEKEAISIREKEQAESKRKAAYWELKERIEQQELSKLHLKQAQAICNRRVVRTPIAGIVVKRYLSAGEYVEQQPILKIAKIHLLFVETISDLENFGKLKVGMHAKVFPENSPNESFDGKITVIDRVVDAASGTFGIRIEVANPDGAITPWPQMQSYHQFEPAIKKPTSQKKTGNVETISPPFSRTGKWRRYIAKKKGYVFYGLIHDGSREDLGLCGDLGDFVFPLDGHQVDAMDAFHLLELLDLFAGDVDAFLGHLAPCQRLADER